MLFMIIGGLIISVVIGLLRGPDVAVFSTITMSLVCLLIALGIGRSAPTEYVLDKQIELVALQDVIGAQGSFFLVTGNVESQSSYVFYQKERTGVKFGKIPTQKAIVYEEERNDGVIKVYTKQITSKWHDTFGLIFLDKKYEIFIPEGSILHRFQLDLE